VRAVVGNRRSTAVRTFYGADAEAHSPGVMRSKSMSPAKVDLRDLVFVVAVARGGRSVEPWRRPGEQKKKPDAPRPVPSGALFWLEKAARDISPGREAGRQQRQSRAGGLAVCSPRTRTACGPRGSGGLPAMIAELIGADSRCRQPNRAEIASEMACRRRLVGASAQPPLTNRANIRTAAGLREATQIWHKVMHGVMSSCSMKAT